MRRHTESALFFEAAHYAAGDGVEVSSEVVSGIGSPQIFVVVLRGKSGKNVSGDVHLFFWVHYMTYHIKIGLSSAKVTLLERNRPSEPNRAYPVHRRSQKRQKPA